MISVERQREINRKCYHGLSDSKKEKILERNRRNKRWYAELKAFRSILINTY